MLFVDQFPSGPSAALGRLVLVLPRAFMRSARPPAPVVGFRLLRGPRMANFPDYCSGELPRPEGPRSDAAKAGSKAPGIATAGQVICFDVGSRRVGDIGGSDHRSVIRIPQKPTAPNGRLFTYGSTRRVLRRMQELGIGPGPRSISSAGTQRSSQPHKFTGTDNSALKEALMEINHRSPE